MLATDNRRHFCPFSLPDTKTDHVSIDLFTLGQLGAGARAAWLVPSLTGLATIEGSKRLIARVGPDTATLIGLTALGAAALFLSTARGKDLRTAVALAAAKAGPPIAELLAEAAAASERVHAFAVEPTGEPSALTVVARRLAIGQTSMATREIAQELRMHGFSFDSRLRHESAARGWLEAEPCFHEVQRGHWTLGYHVAPSPSEPGQVF